MPNDPVKKPMNIAFMSNPKILTFVKMRAFY